ALLGGHQLLRALGHALLEQAACLLDLGLRLLEVGDVGDGADVARDASVVPALRQRLAQYPVPSVTGATEPVLGAEDAAGHRTPPLAHHDSRIVGMQGLRPAFAE